MKNEKGKVIIKKNSNYSALCYTVSFRKKRPADIIIFSDQEKVFGLRNTVSIRKNTLAQRHAEEIRSYFEEKISWDIAFVKVKTPKNDKSIMVFARNADISFIDNYSWYRNVGSGEISDVLFLYLKNLTSPN